MTDDRTRELHLKLFARIYSVKNRVRDRLPGGGLNLIAALVHMLPAVPDGLINRHPGIVT